MPTPTALQRKPELLAESDAHNVPLPENRDEDLLLEAGLNGPEEDDVAATKTATSSVPLNDTEMQIDEEGRPRFPPAAPEKTAIRIQSRKVPVPPHRMTPLKAAWPKIYPPLVEHLLLQVRMNVKSRCVEMRTSKHTTDASALQKGEDFVKVSSGIEHTTALIRRVSHFHTDSS